VLLCPLLALRETERYAVASLAPLYQRCLSLLASLSRSRSERETKGVSRSLRERETKGVSRSLRERERESEEKLKSFLRSQFDTPSPRVEWGGIYGVE
jgi:hypothetical protein